MPLHRSFGYPQLHRPVCAHLRARKRCPRGGQVQSCWPCLHVTRLGGSSPVPRTTAVSRTGATSDGGLTVEVWSTFTESAMRESAFLRSRVRCELGSLKAPDALDSRFELV